LDVFAPLLFAEAESDVEDPARDRVVGRSERALVKPNVACLRESRARVRQHLSRQLVADIRRVEAMLLEKVRERPVPTTEVVDREPASLEAEELCELLKTQLLALLRVPVDATRRGSVLREFAAVVVLNGSEDAVTVQRIPRAARRMTSGTREPDGRRARGG